MKYLLDTHILIGFISGDEQLSLYAKELIENEDNELLVSIASLWEMAIKFNLGKLELGQPFEDLFPKQLEENNIEESFSLDGAFSRILPHLFLPQFGSIPSSSGF